jgi:hypothetical protein
MLYKWRLPMAPQTQALRSMDHDVRTTLRFALEMAGAVALLAGAKWLTHVPVSDRVLGIMLQLLPIVPVWLILLACVRHYFRIDEFQRLRFAQAAALTSGITLCLSWSYPIARAVVTLPPQAPDQSVPFAIVFLIVTFVLNCWGLLTAVRGRRAR